ncbi:MULTISPECIES: hypothetical protein [Streptomyces]|uniref:hypothetical protein n=1 Tax=Streptomyces TaxID=1883 RepID=UPI00167645EF|nr:MULTISPECIES: hypothetical protein [Streptomyces]MBK3525437.1 hypothetical protein [Streptomyces sp. MBT70]GGS09466.1 hypothetical protein GCM10010236_74950 [Streptomyces eurythermus]
MSESCWHRGWKNWGRATELRGPDRRSDCLLYNGWRLEIQSRALGPDEFRSREQTADAWLFDGRKAYTDHRLLLQEDDRVDIVFRWQPCWPTLQACRRPVYIDIGEHVLAVLWWNFHGRCATGAASRHSRSAMQSWMKYGIPLMPST